MLIVGKQPDSDQEETNVFVRAIEKYGVAHQLIVAIEEMAELQKETTKALRNCGSREHIIEEIADVEIMLFQMKQIFHIKEEDIADYKNAKALRLQKRMDQEDEK
ncbi:hypothetical protein ACPA0F_08925 [Solibacillus silvestris]